ncbi:MAG TPA: 1-phosphofructokinase family hexose kinase [Bryobacteraceae bacterium]|nr:1-phosphofructokinase family hexose kinase [Bryobacteraceae bacterium]
MIVTLTANPAIDRTITVDRLVFEDRAYILSTTESAGGRGINASHVLASFGSNTLAILVSGGPNGKRMEELLSKEGFPFEAVPIASEVRTNLTISDQQGLTVKLNEVGPTITEKEAAHLEEVVAGRLDGVSWLMLCGSLPPGTTPQLYCRLVRVAQEKGVSTLLDTDGDALLHALEVGPTIVKPNQQEAERLLNRALITRAHFLEAVTRIKGMGAHSVMLSLGARGVVAASDEGAIEAIPPRVDALCPIGAGDASAAAFAWAAENGKPFADCVRWAVAAGTASARLPGTTFANFEQTQAMSKGVEVRPAVL